MARDFRVHFSRAPADERPTSNGRRTPLSLRVLRFAVVSSIVLCASRVLAQEAPPTAPAESSTSVTPPRLIRAEPAIVPDSETLTEAVTVTLALTIDETGHVAECAVLESGGERFDQSARAAIQQFEFGPARRDGVAVAAKIRYRYVFPAQPPLPAPEVAPPAATAPSAAPETATMNAPSQPEEFSAVATVEAPPREPTRRSISGEVLTEMPGTRGDALRAIEVLPSVGAPP